MTEEEKTQIIKALSDEISRQELIYKVTADKWQAANIVYEDISSRKYVEGQKILNLRRMLDAFKRDFDIKI
jgi:hypothetical protein